MDGGRCGAREADPSRSGFSEPTAATGARAPVGGRRLSRIRVRARVRALVGGAVTLLVVDTREIHGLVRQLEVFSSKALPYAIRDSLNRSALAAKNVWADEIRSSMILRNRWTLGSLRVVNATGMDPRRMVAVTGSIARYMGTQEEGGKKTKHGKHGVAIPTKTASGEGRGSGPRQRLVRGPMKLGSIQVQNRTGISRKQSPFMATLPSPAPEPTRSPTPLPRIRPIQHRQLEPTRSRAGSSTPSAPRTPGRR